MLSQTGYERRGAYYLCPVEGCHKSYRRISLVNTHMKQSHGKTGLVRVITFSLPERIVVRMDRVVQQLEYPSRTAFLLDVLDNAISNRLASYKKFDNLAGTSRGWKHCDTCGKAYRKVGKLHEHQKKQHPVNRP